MVDGLPASHLVRMPAEFRLRGHGHDRVHICALVGGGFRERNGSGEELLTAGTLRLSPPGQHDLTFGKAGAECAIVEVPASDATHVLRRRLGASTFTRGSGAARLTGLLRAAIEQQSALRVEEVSLEILAQFDRAARGPRWRSPPPPWLVRARERLLDEYRDPPTAAVLAAEAGVHRVQLVRMFRDHFGLAVAEFSRRRRLARARELLRCSELPIAEVAAACGFADQAHLTRMMRQRAGVTPAVLRAG